MFYGSRYGSKHVYYIDGKSFISDKGTTNGKSKAKEYALNNMLDIKDIITFDSEMEYKRYLYLLEKEKQGEIYKLHHHFVFLLLPAFEDVDGEKHEELTYEADFVYFNKNGLVVEDVKGAFEDTFKIKEKLFDYMKREEENPTCIHCYKLKGGKYIDYLADDSWIRTYTNKTKAKSLKSTRKELQLAREILHKQEMANNLKQREIARLKELQEKIDLGDKLSKQQRLRYEQLKEKYNVLKA